MSRRPLATFIVHLSLALASKSTASTAFMGDVIVIESDGANPFNDAVIKEPTTGVAQGTEQ